MDATTLLVVATAFIVAGFVKGTVGIGMPATAIAILGTVFGVREAIPLVAIPAIMFNLFQINFGKGFSDITKRFWSLSVTMAAGIWIGTQFMASVDARLLSTALGIMLGTNAILSLMKVRLRVPRESEVYLSPIVGATSGVLAGLTGTILVPFAIYMQALSMDREEFLRGVSLALLVAATFWISALFHTGVLTLDNVWVSALSMLPTGLGFVIGTWCRRRVSAEQFQTWIMIALLCAAVNLLRKGLLPF